MSRETTVTTRTMPGPDTIVAHTLGNGLRVFVYPNPSVPAVVVDGAIPGGSVHEPPPLNGLAALTASMLRRGTRKHAFDELNDILDGLGAAVEFSGGRHAVDVFAQCLSEDLPEVLALMAEMIREPAFPEPEFHQLKQQTLTHIQERHNDTRAMAFLTFRRLLYGDHPYGRPVTGEEESVTRITVDDVKRFYAQHIGPKGAHLVIVGDVQPDDVIRQVEALLGDWEGGQAPLEVPPVKRVRARQQEHVPLADKSQTDIVLGWLGVSRRHPDWTPLVVANTLWGQFGMGGRLGDRVREKQGMAYYAYGTVEGNFGPGIWAAVAGVAPQNVPRAVALILEEVRRLREEPVRAEELADVQAFLIGSLPLRLETNEGLAAVIGDMVWYDLGLDYLLTYEERVRSVSAADIQRVAQTYMSDEVYVLATAGPEVSREGSANEPQGGP